MFESSSSIAPQGYYESNKKIYSKNALCYTVSNMAPSSEPVFDRWNPNFPQFDAAAFSKWLQNAFRKSSFKTITELAEAVASNKATISRLMNGAAQTLTGKPSQPKAALVILLAHVLNADAGEGLYLAGHSVYSIEKEERQPKNLAEFLEALESLGLEQFAFSADKEALQNYTPEDFEELLERIKADVEITIRRKKK